MSTEKKITTTKKNIIFYPMGKEEKGLLFLFVCLGGAWHNVKA